MEWMQINCAFAKSDCLDIGKKMLQASLMRTTGAKDQFGEFSQYYFPVCILPFFCFLTIKREHLVLI